MVETWVIYAFIGFIGYFFVNFLFKFVSSENPLMISLILYGTAAISMLVLLAPKMQFALSTKAIIIAAIIGISSVVATVFALKSIALAPNPGYSGAIYSANFVLVTLISVLVFGSSLSLVKFIGVAAVFIGLVLLSLY